MVLHSPSTDVEIVRWCGRIGGIFGISGSLLTLYSVGRLLCALHASGLSRRIGGKGSKADTFFFFLFLFCMSIGDFFLAFGMSPLSFGLDDLSNAQTFCTIQGIFLEIGASVSIVFAALMAVETYFLFKPMTCSQGCCTNTNRPYLLLSMGFACLFAMWITSSVAFGFGANNVDKVGWCWVLPGDNFSLAFHTSFYMYLYVSEICIGVFFFLVVCHIRKTAKATGTALGRRKLCEAFLKLGLYPVVYAIFWLPATVHRVLNLEKSTGLLAFHGTCVATIGFMNFLILIKTNGKVRKYLPYFKTCCRNGSKDDGSSKERQHHKGNKSVASRMRRDQHESQGNMETTVASMSSHEIELRVSETHSSITNFANSPNVVSPWAGIGNPENGATVTGP